MTAISFRQAKRIVKERRFCPALIFYIVDGKDGFGIRAPTAVKSAAVDDAHGRLPIMAVQNIRLKVDRIQRRHHSFGKISKAFTVIKVAVDGIAGAEIILVVNEIDLQLLFACFQAENADIALAP